MARSLYLLFLDPYHLGDDLFLDGLAQQFSRADAGEPSCLIVHGSGEKIERTFESQGKFPERVDGVLDVSDAEDIRLVERAVREVNQDLVATLTEEVVSTVGVQGVDRNLLQMGETGGVQAHNVGWLAALLQQRILPVVSALAEHPDEGRVREVNPAAVLVALAEALAEDFDPTAVLFTTTDQPGLVAAGGTRETVDVDAAASADAIAAPEAVRSFAAAGLPMLITNAKGLLSGEAPSGTHVATADAPDAAST
jgi:acetylglutamate kinase